MLLLGSVMTCASLHTPPDSANLYHVSVRVTPLSSLRCSLPSGYLLISANRVCVSSVQRLFVWELLCATWNLLNVVYSSLYTSQLVDVHTVADSFVKSSNSSLHCVNEVSSLQCCTAKGHVYSLL